MATGNPAPGQAMPRKKIKMETPDEVLKRLAEFRAHKKAGTLPPPTEVAQSHPAPAAEYVRGLFYCSFLIKSFVVLNVISRKTNSKTPLSLYTPANSNRMDTLPNPYQLGLPAIPLEQRAYPNDHPKPHTGSNQVLLPRHRVTISIS